MAPVPPPTDHPVGTTSRSYLANLENSIILPIPSNTVYISIKFPAPPNHAVDFFLECLPNPESFIVEACRIIDKVLYSSKQADRRSQGVTLILDDFDGLAYTSHASIHLSLRWISEHAARRDVHASAYEFKGVILHELTHVLQFDGGGSAPWWFIEGLADYVRLSGGFGAKHWKREGEGGSWEDGYDTTAVFFNWLNTSFGDEVLQTMNHSLERKLWDGAWWAEITGRTIKQLWHIYKNETKLDVAVISESTLKVQLKLSS